MGGLGLNGIKVPMAIEKIKILGVVLELLGRQHNQILNISLSHITYEFTAGNCKNWQR